MTFLENAEELLKAADLMGMYFAVCFFLCFPLVIDICDRLSKLEYCAWPLTVGLHFLSPRQARQSKFLCRASRCAVPLTRETVLAARQVL